MKGELTMKKLKAKFNEILKDESGQGMTEYILLVVVVVAIAIIFKSKIKSAIDGKMDQLSGSIGNFTGDN